MEALLLQTKPSWSPSEISSSVLWCILCISPHPAIRSLMKEFFPSQHALLLLKNQHSNPWLL